jgi:hypothetical protein
VAEEEIEGRINLIRRRSKEKTEEAEKEDEMKQK